MLAIETDPNDNHQTIINAIPEIKELQVPKFELSQEAQFMIDSPSNEQKDAYIIKSLDKLSQQSNWNTDMLVDINNEIRTTNQHVNKLEVWYITHKQGLEESIKLSQQHEKYFTEKSWIAKWLTTGVGRLFTVFSGVLASIVMGYEVIKIFLK